MILLSHEQPAILAAWVLSCSPTQDSSRDKVRCRKVVMCESHGSGPAQSSHGLSSLLVDPTLTPSSNITFTVSASSRCRSSCGMILFLRQNTRLRSWRDCVRRSPFVWSYSQLHMAKKKARIVSWWYMMSPGSKQGHCTISCSNFRGIVFCGLGDGSLLL